MKHTPTPCFACNRPMVGKSPILVRCADEQTVFVGSNMLQKHSLHGQRRLAASKGRPTPLLAQYTRASHVSIYRSSPQTR